MGVAAGQVARRQRDGAACASFREIDRTRGRIFVISNQCRIRSWAATDSQRHHDVGVPIGLDGVRQHFDESVDACGGEFACSRVRQPFEIVGSHQILRELCLGLLLAAATVTCYATTLLFLPRPFGWGARRRGAKGLRNVNYCSARVIAVSTI